MKLTNMAIFRLQYSRMAPCMELQALMYLWMQATMLSSSRRLLIRMYLPSSWNVKKKTWVLHHSSSSSVRRGNLNTCFSNIRVQDGCAKFGDCFFFCRSILAIALKLLTQGYSRSVNKTSISTRTLRKSIRSCCVVILVLFKMSRSETFCQCILLLLGPVFLPSFWC